MSFSFDPPRPDTAAQGGGLLVRLRKVAQSKRVTLPCRLNLHYLQGAGLVFSDAETSFWVELTSAGTGQVEAKIFVNCTPEGQIEEASFIARTEESPILTAQELPEGSPFRILAEGKWWGRDLFRQRHAGGTTVERLEIGKDAGLINLSEKEWLVWENGIWQKLPFLDGAKMRPIARLRSANEKSLLLEGWDADRHVCLSFGLASAPPLKARGEDLFSSIRVRSEKQISCMMEKQCLILKTGDWVLKSGSRWQVLRKKEERDAYLMGKLVGDLFVFERIDLRQGQKVIQGDLFNTGRSQMIPIEIAANSGHRQGSSKHTAGVDRGFRRGKQR